MRRNRTLLLPPDAGTPRASPSDRRLARRALIAAAMSLYLGGWLPDAAAQTPGPTAKVPTELLNRVLHYRINFVESSTPFEACSLYRAMATPTDFPDSFFPGVQRLLSQRDSGQCLASPSSAQLPPSGAPSDRRVVRLDETNLDDTTAMLRFTVMVGEMVHHEDYTAIRESPTASWGVKEVRIWGAMQYRFRYR
jgi:hypothetical protein